MNRLQLTLFSALTVFVAACSNTDGAVEGSVNGGIDGGSGIWNFTNASDYTFDSNYISVSGDRAALKTVNTTFNSAGTFNTGTRIGSAFSGSALRVDTATAGDTSHSSLWTPKWANVVGYWKLDGNWLDSSATMANGSATGSPTFTTGKTGGQAATFNGTSQSFVSGANAALDSAAHSFCVWMNPTANAGLYTRVFEKGGYGIGGGFSLEMGLATPHFIEWIDAGSTCQVSASAPLLFGAWAQVCGTFDGTTSRLYVDGAAAGNLACAGITTNTSPITFAKAANSSSDYYEGSIDEMTVWNTVLSADDIATIYTRQRAKYSGLFISPIVDAGAASAPWTSLNLSTTLPFGKELPAGNESSSHYSALVNSSGATGSGNSLSSGLMALWHFNASSGTSLADSSTTGLTATASRAAITGQTGLLGNGLLLDSVSSDHATTASINMGNLFTISVWVRVNEVSPGWHTLIANSDYGSTDGFKLAINSYGTDDGRVIFETANGTLLTAAQTGLNAVTGGRWRHVVARVDRLGGSAEIYVDGKLENSGTTAIRTDFKVSDVLYIGAMTSLAGAANARLDEIAIWQRLLTPAEILQVYRRGANRLQYQARSCVDSACACRAFNTSPAGSATDCDGDGVLNAADLSDSFEAKWLGPDGSGKTYFSELHNNASVDAAGMPTGTVATTSALTVDWSGAFFTAAARPAANRYFQYRAFLESDDEKNLCSGAPCVPEITSLAIGPTLRYWGGSPTIVNNTPVSFTALSGITKTDTNSCSSFQLSTDGGTTYKWWDSAANSGAGGWATAGNTPASANSIADFTADRLLSLGTGSFKFKAFLNTNTAGDFSQACELDRIGLSFTP